MWDRWADEIELEGVVEAEAGLRTATRALADRVLCAGTAIRHRGYQLHGDLLDPARWDLALGRAAGEAEIHTVDTHRLAGLRPGLGRIVAAVHPGALLPCGSITKVLGHRFDRELANDGRC